MSNMYGSESNSASAKSHSNSLTSLLAASEDEDESDQEGSIVDGEFREPGYSVKRNNLTKLQVSSSLFFPFLRTAFRSSDCFIDHRKRLATR